MNTRINRSNLTDQVAAELAESIRSRKFKAGDQLPSVERLAIDMGVGRSSIREGLRLLQARGLVEIVHGLGTFVAPERITRTSGIVFSFTETILERGMQPRSEILQQEVIVADAETAGKLQIEIGDPVNLLKRLRFADNIPMALETTMSAYKRFPDLMAHDWNGTASLYAFLQERYQVRPISVSHIVQAVTATSSQSKQLLIPAKNPLLLVETTAYDESGVPIEYGRSYYRADRYEYRVQLN